MRRNPHLLSRQKFVSAEQQLRQSANAQRLMAELHSRAIAAGAVQQMPGELTFESKQAMDDFFRKEST